MNIGAAGIALIKEFEGFPFGGRPYFDHIGGVWTIGYGHTAGVGPHSPRLTERQASELLERDLAQFYEPAVERLPTARFLNHNQFDALVVFVYNVGGGAIAADTGIGKALRERQWQRAADELLRWNKGNGGVVINGLTRRRQAERKLFLTPSADRPLALLTRRERRWCREYDELVAAKRAGHDTPQAHDRLGVLRRAMERRRKAIWRAAEAVTGGWAQAHRRVRYRALRARTT
jgi:GH24 family phage-related lysozyme (muramidase)